MRSLRRDYSRALARPFHERLLSKVLVGDDCWGWRGATQKGYASLQQGRRGEGLTLGHRAVYELLIGPIPAGLELDHLCRNKICVNPGHLEPVTHAVNMRRWAAWRKKQLGDAPWRKANTSTHPSPSR